MHLFNGDCLDVLQTLPANSVDLVLADPPYAKTKLEWDSIIPLDPLWRELKRVTKERAAIVLMAGQPFTSILIVSNLSMFRYTWVWNKKTGANFGTAKYQPLREHEDVCVFYKRAPTYNPQMIMRTASSLLRDPVDTKRVKRAIKYAGQTPLTGGPTCRDYKIPPDGKRHPRSIIEASKNSEDRGYHPTQKPVDLMSYFIRTYSNENDVILDFCMGSGSTGVAAANLRRRFIGIERDTKNGYFAVAEQRINTALEQEPILTPF